MTSPHCHLTAKDSTYLNSLLNAKSQDEDLLALLRAKLAKANVMLDHAIDPRIATIDSRIEFSVGGGFTEERILTRDEKGNGLARALPVTTPRGLALLGLKEGDVYSFRKPNGIIEPIRLIKVTFQPEAAERGVHPGEVVDFHSRWMKTISGTANPPSDNDDMGPTGPGAA